jgi:hypothetical protein
MSNGTTAGGLPDIQSYAKILAEVSPKGDALPLSTITLDSIATHDFPYYEFLLATDVGYSGLASQGLSDAGLAYLDAREAEGVAGGMVDVLSAFLGELEATIRAAANQYYWRFPTGADAAAQQLITSIYQDQTVMAWIFDVYVDAGPLHEAFLADFRNSLIEELGLADSTPYTFSWDTWLAHATSENFTVHVVLGEEYDVPIHHHALTPADYHADNYPFEVFPFGTVNVGQRLVYRQDWTLLGRQVGEVVRTIPLGPGQKERVSTKIVRRRKSTITTEEVTETESTTETADTTKDSNEVVREAASTLNWKVEAEVHGGISLIGGSVHGSIGGTSEDRSKSTSSALSEAMRKAAEKIRRQTKAVVSTETEQSFERDTASEISNPNNEIAVAYEYCKLQQQYQVFTYLAELEAVIFAAEVLPLPSQIDDDWVRRYDWIISKVLKDESHRQALNDLIQDRSEADPVDYLNPNSSPSDNPFKAMAETASKWFGQFQQQSGAAGAPAPSPNQGLAIPDIYAEPQRIYQQYLKDWAARQRANKLRVIRRDRLIRHITDNILHYAQAIWRSEDADQRLLRYKKEGRQVPIMWSAPIVFVPNPFGPGGQYTVIGAFTPTGQTAPLWEMIDPTGPIDYIGNYAVFALRPLPEGDPETRIPRLGGKLNIGTITLGLNQLLARMRSSYVGPYGDLLDPALRACRREAAGLSDQQRRQIDDAKVNDILAYLPELETSLKDARTGQVRRNANGELTYQITAEQWAQYLYRKNSTRRFLVDSNNLYLNLSVGAGAALEPFKRAHRYIDVFRAAEDVQAADLKNQRRAALLRQPGEYDPDVAKVVVVEGNGAATTPAHEAALAEAFGGRFAGIDLLGGGRAPSAAPNGPGAAPAPDEASGPTVPDGGPPAP